MSTTAPAAHTITTGKNLADTLAACVMAGQIVRTMADATRPALRDFAISIGAYEGHSRDTRANLKTHVVNAYLATRTDLGAPAVDVDTAPTGRCYTGKGLDHWSTPATDDAANAILDLIGRSRAAHNADRTTAAAPAAPRTPRAPRANAAAKFVSADHPDGRRCVGHCGRDLPVTGFFPLTKVDPSNPGATVRSAECSRCIDERRAVTNPTSILGARTMDAMVRRLARPGADPAPAGYVPPAAG